MASESQTIAAVYIVYVFATVAVFAWRPSLTTALVALGLGWMLLPVEVFAPHTITAESFTIEVIGVALPSVPLVTKGWIAPCAVLLALVVARASGRWRPERHLRFVAADLAIAMFCLAPLLPWASGRIDASLAVAQCLYLSGVWGATWLIGRVLLGTTAARLRFAGLLTWSGLALLPVAVLEGPRPPWLYGAVYGPHPFQLEGADRYLGYRPMGWFEHGNQYGIWMAMASLAALWLCLEESRKRLTDVLLAAVLGLAALASQSVGAVFLAGLGALWLILTARWRRGAMLLLAATVGLGAPAYLSGRVPLEHWAMNTSLGQAAVGKLREAGNRSFNFFSSRHHQIGKLIDHQHDVWQESVAFFRVEFAANKFCVVLFQITCTSIFQDFIPVFHFNTQRIERVHNFLGIGNDRLFAVWKFREVMPFNLTEQRHFHFLRIDQYKLQL